MGIGIWSMHFIGMLAYKLPIPLEYDISLTLLSLLVAVLVSGFALHIVSHGTLQRARWFWSSLAMGCGIAAMHYTGMAAMQMDAAMRYRTDLLLLSILIAIIAAHGALYLAFQLHGLQGRALRWRKIISAHVMGFAIAAMHYTGMAATVVTHDAHPISGNLEVHANTGLILLVAIITSLLLLLSLAAVRVDRYITAKQSALARSEQHVSQLMNGAADAMITIDKQGHITSFNPQAERIFGYATTEVIGRNISELMPSPYREAHDGYMQRYLQGNGSAAVGFGARELVALRKTGETFPIELSVSRFDLSEREEGFIGILRDISERKRIESDLKTKHNELQQAHNQLQETHQQLLQSEKMASIGQLAAGVAHEINNPIGYISSNITTLEGYIADLLMLLQEYSALEQELGPESPTVKQLAQVKRQIDLNYLAGDVQQLLSESKEGLTRVKTIIQDLKNFSHVDAEDWQLADLHQGLNSTLNIVHNEIKYRANVIKEYGELPMIECIASQLNQVFMNMLVNAAHAIEGSGTITIGTGRHEDTVWVKISDTGKGIPEALHRKIFDPFFTTKPVGQGTGLGLSLSYGIVTKHHGKIDVQSKVGHGTTFIITLPIRQPKKADS
ncbi:MAG: MHYT domain-containing protein [Pseudomonadota bacterium]